MGNERRGGRQATLPAQLVRIHGRPDELGPLRSPGCTGCLSPPPVPLETAQSRYSESWKETSTTQVGTKLPSTRRPAKAVTDPSPGGGTQARRRALTEDSLRARAAAPSGASSEEVKKRSPSQMGSSSFSPHHRPSRVWLEPHPFTGHLLFARVPSLNEPVAFPPTEPQANLR